MKKLILFFGLTIIIALSTCTENPINGDDNITPGRRDYVWTTDSIDYEGLPTTIEIKSMWGSSPTDVWGAHFTGDVRNCLWHFDGKVWKRAVEGTPITQGGNGSAIVGGVWGTAQNDVWAFGGKRFSNPERIEPFVMHFNGNNWTEVQGDTANMPNGFWDVIGVEKDHFWVTTADDVFRYKNGEWKRFFIRENSIIPSIAVNGGQIYLTDYLIGVDSLFLYKLNGNEFEVVDQTNLFNGSFGAHGLILLNNKAYTFNENGVYTSVTNNGVIQPSNWSLEFPTSSPNGFFNSHFRGENDIWAVGFNEYPYQYNGKNWDKLNIYNGAMPVYGNSFFGIWGNGKEIFICDKSNGIIYHGK